MKIIEKITLILYSNIILIMSVILCLLVFGWLDANVVANLATINRRKIIRNNFRSKCSIYLIINKMYIL